MLESLTAMGVDSEDSRERRAPWGVLKFLKAREKAKARAVSFELDKLMIWVPAPCAVDIIKNMVIELSEVARIQLPIGASYLLGHCTSSEGIPRRPQYSHVKTHNWSPALWV